MKPVTLLTLIATLVSGSIATAQTEKLRLSCADKVTFNYGKLDVLVSATQVRLVMSSTTLGSVGRTLFGREAKPTRNIEIIVPEDSCAIPDFGTRIPLRCIHSPDTEVILTDYLGVVSKFKASYVQVETLVRTDETVNPESDVKRVVSELYLAVGEDNARKIANVPTDFHFNECIVF